jgi:hypothetical protein
MHGKTVEDFNGQPGKWVPIATNSAGQLNMQLLAGELQQFNRQAGGPIVLHTAVLSADAAVVSGPCIFYGVKVVTTGTSITVYDSVTATGTAVITAEATTTAGAMIYPAGPGVGVLMDNGIYLDLTTGTYIVYYVPAG